MDKCPNRTHYDGDIVMGTFINDAIYNDLNTDGVATNDVDMVFNNAGGLRADMNVHPHHACLPMDPYSVSCLLAMQRQWVI